MSKQRREAVPEIDLHGLNREEAIAEVERELNHTFIQDEAARELRFITGWGSVLRPEVTDYLTDHPLVKEMNCSGPSITVLLEDM